MKPQPPIRVRQAQLALLGLGATGLLLLAGVDRSSTPQAIAQPSAQPAVDCSEPILSRAVLDSERQPARQRLSARTAEGPLAPRPIDRAAAEPRTEREFLAEFLALERARPGNLEERAEALVSGTASNAEKVAFLRALEQCGSQQHLMWLERSTSSLPDDSGPQGVSVARYALERLVAAARTDGEALSALRRLAFEARGLAPDLRRSAALGLAQSAGESELGELGVALARETDAVLVAGVVAALRDRPPSPQAARLLAAFDAADPIPSSVDE